jgi:patatin-like phospholipase/acyl hydrolase
MIKVVAFKKLKNNTKKYEITFEKNGKKYTRKFGAAGMSDFTINKDRERRERYISRHKKDLKTKDPMKAGYLSMFILWNKPSLSASLTDYKRRLNTFNKTGKFPIGITGSKKLSFGGPYDNTSLSKLPDDILQLINEQKSATVIQDTSKEYNPKRSLIEELKIEGLKRYKTSLVDAHIRGLTGKRMKNLKKDILNYVNELWTNLDPVNDFTAKWLTRASKVLVKKDFDFRTRNFWWKVIENQIVSMNEIESDGNPVDLLNDVEFEYYEKCKRAIIVILNTVGYTFDTIQNALAWWKTQRTNVFGTKKLSFGSRVEIQRLIEKMFGPYDDTTLSKLPVEIRKFIKEIVGARIIQDAAKKYNPKRALIEALIIKSLQRYKALSVPRSENYKKGNMFLRKLWTNLDPTDDFTAKWLTKASNVLVKTDFNFITRNFWWKVIETQMMNLNNIEFLIEEGETLTPDQLENYNTCKNAVFKILIIAGYTTFETFRGAIVWPGPWWRKRRTSDGTELDDPEDELDISDDALDEEGMTFFGDSPIPDNVVNKKLYASIKSKIKKSTTGRRWGAYDSGRLVREYKSKGGKYKGGKGEKGKGGKGNSNLGRWYKEKWVDACAWPKRKSCSNKNITYCRPSKRVDAKTPRLVQKFKLSQLKSRCSKKKKNPMKRVTKFGIPPSRKDNIPLLIKKQVWARDCHQADPRVAQCKTCFAVVKYPQSLSQYFTPGEVLPYNVSGTGEYGHIIAEANGGRITVENLFIQCKSCNTQLGANTAVLQVYNDDQFMLEGAGDDPMLVDSGSGNVLQCTAITGKKVQCRNKALPNRSFCGIHCNN